jgi:hypothetical protein
LYLHATDVDVQIRVGTVENYFDPGPIKTLPAELREQYQVGGVSVCMPVMHATQSASAFELWFRCAERAVRDDPSVLVYVATDSPAVLDAAKARFGDNLVYYNGQLCAG